MLVGIFPNKIQYQREGCQFPKVGVFWILKQLQLEDSLGEASGDWDFRSWRKKQSIEKLAKWFKNGWDGGNRENIGKQQAIWSSQHKATKWKIVDVWDYLGKDQSMDKSSSQKVKRY